MSAELIGHFEVESPEWHAARANAIGGSEIAAVLGLSKWASRYSLWHEKRGLMPEREQNSQMTVGKYVEPAVVDWFLDQHPEFTHRTGGTYRSRDRAWQVANPDGLLYVTEGGPALEDNLTALLEVKFAIYDYEWIDGPPPYYLAQCRWYMDVFDLETCYVAVLFGGTGRFAEFVVKQDAADVALMRSEGLAFMESLERGERPDIDEHGATYEALRATAPGVGSGDIEVSAEVAHEFWDAQYMKAQAAEQVQLATNRVMGLLNDTECKRAVHDGKPVAHKESRNGGAPYLKASKGTAA